jgi:hypothetical protein
MARSPNAPNSWTMELRGDVGGDNDDIKFLRSTNGAFAGIAMQIETSTGNVGIGTSTPQATLDVNGFIAASQGIIFPDGTIQSSSVDTAPYCAWGDQVYSPGARCQDGYNLTPCPGNPEIDFASVVFTCSAAGTWTESSSCTTQYLDCGE